MAMEMPASIIKIGINVEGVAKLESLRSLLNEKAKPALEKSNSFSSDTITTPATLKINNNIEKFNADLQNFNTGLTLVSMADEALDSISDYLDNMRTLIQRRGDDIVQGLDKQVLQDEYQSNLEQIAEIAAKTKLEGIDALSLPWGSMTANIHTPNNTKIDDIEVPGYSYFNPTENNISVTLKVKSPYSENYNVTNPIYRNGKYYVYYQAPGNANYYDADTMEKFNSSSFFNTTGGQMSRDGNIFVDVHSDNHIYYQQVNGTTPAVQVPGVTITGSVARKIEIANDDETIFFEKADPDDGNKLKIYRVNKDGSGLQAVTNTVGQRGTDSDKSIYLSLSPDNSRLYWSVEGSWNLYYVDNPMTATNELPTFTFLTGMCPEVSPDGTKLAIMSTWKKIEIHDTTVVGMPRLNTITTSSNINYWKLEWKDDDTLLFSKDDGTGHNKLYEVSASATDDTNATKINLNIPYEARFNDTAWQAIGEQYGWKDVNKNFYTTLSDPAGRSVKIKWDRSTMVSGSDMIDILGTGPQPSTQSEIYISANENMRYLDTKLPADLSNITTLGAIDLTVNAASFHTNTYLSKIDNVKLSVAKKQEQNLAIKNILSAEAATNLENQNILNNDIESINNSEEFKNVLSKFKESLLDSRWEEVYSLHHFINTSVDSLFSSITHSS